MPDFYEHEDDPGMVMNADTADDMERDDQNLPETALGGNPDPKSRPRPPVSAPTRPSSISKVGNPSAPAVRTKPRSASYAISHPSDASLSHRPGAVHKDMQDIQSEDKPSDPGMLRCPICGRMLQTDNQDFNSHIDFCLSRGAIMEAQIEAVRPIRGFRFQEKKGMRGEKK